MIPVVLLNPTGNWDQTMTADMLDGKLWAHHLNLVTVPEGEWPAGAGIILVIPGRFWTDNTPKVGDWRDLNDRLAQYDWVVAFRVGDEEDWFDITKIVHPNIKWWVQEPRTDRVYGDAHLFGVGYTPHFSALPVDPPTKDVDVFLSAQCTHQRRQDCFTHAERCAGAVELNRTAGFTQGVTPEEYAEKMMRAKIAPAPSGPTTPDSFRLYEALQAHSIPIADDRTPGYPSEGYWKTLHPDAPFPIVDDWADLPQLVDGLLAEWPANANRITAWWMREKHRITEWLTDDLAAFGAPSGDRFAITAVIPASPIKSHPDIAIIEETIASIRHHFHDATIIITFDGVRKEQEHLRGAYEESIRRVLWRCDHHWKNVHPIIFDTHTHQVGMMREAIKHIDTPLLMYVEQDCPLVCDEPTDFGKIAEFILDSQADLVRLHHEALILDVHLHLMHGRVGDFTRTSQWSQRPHIASTQFYQRVLDQFTPNANCFIEDWMASVLECAYTEYQMLGWEQWRCWIYTPNSTNIKRSVTTDGRAGGPKFESSQRF